MLGSPIYGNHQIPCLKVPQDMMEQIAKVAWLRPYYFQGNNLPGRYVSNPKPHNGKLGTMEDNLPGYSLGYSVPRLYTNLHTWYLPGIGGPQKRPKKRWSFYKDRQKGIPNFGKLRNFRASCKRRHDAEAGDCFCRHGLAS